MPETLSNISHSWNISKFYSGGPNKPHSSFNCHNEFQSWSQTEPLMQTWDTGSSSDNIYTESLANNTDRAGPCRMRLSTRLSQAKRSRWCNRAVGRERAQGIPEPSGYFLSIPIHWCCHILSALWLELLSQSLQQTELCLQQKSLMGAQKNCIQLLDIKERKWNKWEGLNDPEWQAT